MNIKSLLVLATLAGVVTSASALTTTAANFQAPAPVKTIQPINVPRSHSGSMVNLAMTIDANGKPSNVRVVNGYNQAAYKDIIATVSQWQFSPARRNGQAVSSHVELPLEVKGL